MQSWLPRAMHDKRIAGSEFGLSANGGRTPATGRGPLSPAQLDQRPIRLLSDFAGPLALNLSTLVLPPLEGLLLARNLRVALEPIGLERSTGDGGLDGAARFTIVPAVAEAAGRAECRHVRERLIERLVRVPQLQFAHAGRVDDDPAARQTTSWRCTGVSPAGIPGRTSPVARHPRHERLTIEDLPEPRAPRSDGAPVPQMTVHRLEPRAVSALTACTGTSGARRHVVDRVGVLRFIRLVQDHDGLGAALTHQDQYARRCALRKASMLDTMKTVSIFAATTCSSVSRPATLRENLLRLGRITLITARPPDDGGRNATQSPTAGSACRPGEYLIRPAASASHSPSVVKTR